MSLLSEPARRVCPLRYAAGMLRDERGAAGGCCEIPVGEPSRAIESLRELLPYRTDLIAWSYLLDWQQGKTLEKRACQNNA